ncbi:MAG: hypothetical protein RLY58_2311 [Pseudomonadota bacterium]|jgi:hypothetical protein
MINRESIYAALFDRLSGIAGVVTASRKLKHWSDVPMQEQPAMFVAQGNQTALPGDPSRGLPTKWTLSADVYVYVNTQNSPDSPSTPMNTIIDAIEQRLKPDGMARTLTLGDLVDHCWIEGTIETDEGTLGDQSVAIIPIRILTT